MCCPTQGLQKSLIEHGAITRNAADLFETTFRCLIDLDNPTTDFAPREWYPHDPADLYLITQMIRDFVPEAVVNGEGGDVRDDARCSLSL